MELLRIDYYLGYEIHICSNGCYVSSRVDTQFGNSQKFNSLSVACRWIRQSLGLD